MADVKYEKFVGEAFPKIGVTSTKIEMSSDIQKRNIVEKTLPLGAVLNLSKK